MTPQSVEDCLQSALSSLYPPFEATAPTLLSQVFSVLERTYREDSLRYTLEFLIPAKRILQNVQQQACSQYSGFLFFHEGWPLCLGEKILVQLSSLPWHFLKPGDFYLQVVPYLECSPRLMLKCLSQDGSGVQEILVPESSHSFLFSAEWLNSINKDRSSVRLDNCLAAAEEKVIRLSWSEVIYPQFIHKGGYIVGRKCSLGPLIPPLESRSPGDGGIASGDLVDPGVTAHLSLFGGQENAEEWEGGAALPLEEMSGSLIDCIEGEYVELSPPVKGEIERQESHRNTWATRAKTAPSRKGKNKGNQAWLHPRRPGKVGSLSTLKGKSQDRWEERSYSGFAQDKKESEQEQSYWEVDVAKCPNEAELMAEWRKGLDVLQRHSDVRVSSESQDWISAESQEWITVDSTVKYVEEKCIKEKNASASSPQKDEMLPEMLEICCLKEDTSDIREHMTLTEITGNVSNDCQNKFSTDCLSQPAEENQNEDFQTKQAEQDINMEKSFSQELALATRDRTWADGQETLNVQGNMRDDTTAEENQTSSDGLILISEKEKHPAWAHITEIPHKTGRGRRKKRNKRGRGLVKIEAKKGTHKTGKPKPGSREEKSEPVLKSEENKEENKDNEITTDHSKLEETLAPAISQSDDQPCAILNSEPKPPPQSPSISAEFKCLYKEINWEILELGVFCMTGGYDKDKRALLTVYPEKVSPEQTQRELAHTLLYLHSLLRPELRDLGMTLITDLRGSTAYPDNILQILQESQNSDPTCVHRVLFICDSVSNAVIPGDILNIQVSAVLTKELVQFVEQEELPDNFGGERHYVHTDCVGIQRSLVNLYSLCSDVLESLDKVTQSLNADTSQDIQSLISQHRDAMKSALNDERLQRLQRDGGTLVARLQKSSYLRLCDPITFELYERVDEALHQLVQLSNKRLQELEASVTPLEYQEQSLEDVHMLQDRKGSRDLRLESLAETREQTKTFMEDDLQVAGSEGRRLDVGVRIRGLEVSSRELADRTCSPPRGHVLSRGDGRGPDAPWGGLPEGKRSPQRLLLDLLCSERSYVQSLRRSLEVRSSCPAGLALRGSLEQLLNFHIHFLRGLQNCVSQPLTVSYCFLQHADQLRLYSLYVKNRQKVELFLPVQSGSLKNRLRDKKEEDSWVILQRPLDQLDQYQRFLWDMIQECDQENEQERQSLHSARELVGSLVHHGKNLLAVEAIRGFEVDEKEHGRLLLKDVFTVISGRKKSLRHVFLFQKLLLLSKLKTAEGGLETYGYKQSFKTADMGLTEIATESDLRFELWFRRQKSRETLILQAESVAVKESWTSEITKLLWDQGGLSKEHRVSDTASVGSSHRSFLDIKAGFSAISERTVSALLTARGSRTRLSVAFPAVEHSSPSPPSSLALISGQSPRRLRSPGGMSLPDKIREEVGESFPGGPVCLKSISPITEGEKPKGLQNEEMLPSTSV